MADEPLLASADPDTHGRSGLLTAFHGPYHGGPPPEALEVDAPSIESFGPRELLRMVEIVLLMVVMALRAAAVRVVARRKRTWAEAFSEGVVNGFIVLGPTYVKLGQMIASSPGLFPEPMATACLRCLDDVPSFDGATARRLVGEDLGRTPAQLFIHFDDVPLSAASIAQVHAVTLPDGREAVLKLQRPAIVDRMNRDLRIMYRFARLATRLPKAATVNPVGVVEDLHAVTNQELNFALEAYRQSFFRDHIEAFGDNKMITAPEVYWDWCGPHVICMERMRGVPMDQFDVLRERGVDGELILRRGVKVWMEAAMVHGPFHGDVHAGNLWVLDDGRASYLDFGIMGHLDDDWRLAFRDMQYTAMIDGDYTRIVRNWKKLGVFPADVGDDEEVALRIKVVMDPLLDQKIGDVSLGELMQQNLQLAESFGATSPKELVLMTKQLMYFERYSKELAPDYNMSRDLYLVRNLFPDEVAAKCETEGIELPD